MAKIEVVYSETVFPGTHHKTLIYTDVNYHAPYLPEWKKHRDSIVNMMESYISQQP